MLPNGGPAGSPAHRETRRVASRRVPLRARGPRSSSSTTAASALRREQVGDPTVLADGTLRWAVNVIVGDGYRLRFTTRPGLTLGPAAAKAEITPTGGTTAAAATPATVSVGDTLESNDTPAAARTVDSDDFYLSYLTSRFDVDYFTFPVPAAGSRITFTLSHLPADYDLVVYGPARPAVAARAAVDAADRRPAARRRRVRHDARDRRPAARRRSTTSRLRRACPCSASRRCAAPRTTPSSSSRTARRATTRFRSPASTAPRATSPYMLRADDGAAARSSRPARRGRSPARARRRRRS